MVSAAMYDNNILLLIANSRGWVAGIAVCVRPGRATLRRIEGGRESTTSHRGWRADDDIDVGFRDQLAWVRWIIRYRLDYNLR